MNEYGVQLRKILSHLFKYSGSGNLLRCRDDILQLIKLEEEERETVLAAFAENGIETLKPVFETLNGRVSYDDLRIMRLIYAGRKSDQSENEG